MTDLEIVAGVSSFFGYWLGVLACWVLYGRHRVLRRD
jgi:hypothetical protein